MTRREQMPAHERFKLSYFGDSRHGQHRPREPQPRPLRLATCDTCAGCGVARRSGEQGWWVEGRTYWHFACVTDQMLSTHIEKWGRGKNTDNVVRARRGKK